MLWSNLRIAQSIKIYNDQKENEQRNKEYWAKQKIKSAKGGK